MPDDGEQGKIKPAFPIDVRDIQYEPAEDAPGFVFHYTGYDSYRRLFMWDIYHYDDGTHRVTNHHYIPF